MIALTGGRLAAEVQLPKPSDNESIVFGADSANRWNQGAYEVWILHGKCYINQGLTTARSDEAVLWVRRSGEFGSRENRIIVYLEGNVHIDYQRAGFPYQLSDNSWLGEFFSTVPIEVRVTKPQGEPPDKPAVYRNALAKRDPFANRALQRTQFSQFDNAVRPPDALPAGSRRLRLFPRSAVKVQAEWFPNPAGDEWIAVFNTGVNLIIDGMQGTGAIDVSTDRMVLWTKGKTQPDLTGQTTQQDNTPLEIYMEGNIVFRQGERVIQAERMYFDVNNQVGTVLQADVLTPVPSYKGLLRLRAEVAQQTGPDRFFAHNAFITSSRMESPGYRMQARDVYFEDIQKPLVNAFTGEPQINPATGEPIVSHQQLATSRNNLLFLGPAPVFYWPVLATDLSQPSYYVRRAQFREDSIFGTQFLTSFDAFQLLGIKQKPSGVDWIVSFDYFSYRGPATGSTVTYQREQFLGLTGPTVGYLDGFLIHDDGLDRLGSDRYNIKPETDIRYRILGRQRQYLANNWRITAEVGKISDRNFLEQYFPYEWNALKDQSTDLELKRLVDNMSYGIRMDVRLNDFFTETNNLPKADHYWLGQSLLGDHLTWYEHSTASYSQLQVFTPPTDPTQAAKQTPLPWEVPAQGEIAISRQEIDLPVAAGPVKLVPYLMGELGHWGQNIAGDAENRAYGVAGIRGSIPFWTANPNIDSTLFNVHGIAHKVVLDADLNVSETNQSLTSLPLYQQLDDNAQEYFRRRFRYNTFGGTTPFQFDERDFALRSGLGTQVTSPSMEVAGNLAALRFGARQRWQTKRGPPTKRRIIDWIVLDTGATFFPDYNRDNFGAPIGLVNYDARWHIGDRLTLTSNGLYDFFAEGEKITSIMAQISRPPRGSLYVGFYSLQGPFSQNLLSTYYTYRMSPKWVSAAGVSFDIAGLGMVGNNLTLTRVGESFLTSFNFVYNKYQNNIGVNFMLEPRFMARTRTGNVGGASIPLAGAAGLE